MRGRRLPKRVSTRRRSRQQHRLRLGDAIGYGALVGLVLTIGYLLGPQVSLPSFQQGSQLPGTPRILRAAVVDQLSSLSSGRGMADAVTRTLARRGISFDVYSMNDITVGFYRDLPIHGYGLIIMRVHTGIGDPGSPVPIGLYTNEPYDANRFVIEQATDRVAAVQTNEGSLVYFAVTPKFIRNDMRGSFNGAVVVLGGCYGVRKGELPQAFIDRGARVIVGWTGVVDLTHTDRAIPRFIEEFVLNGKSVGDAVEATMRAVGPDPYYGSELSYYGANVTLAIAALILADSPNSTKDSEPASLGSPAPF